MEPGGVPEQLEVLKVDRRLKSRRRRGRWWIAGAVALAVAVAAILIARRPPTVAVGQVRALRPGEEQSQLTAAGFVVSRRQSILAPKIAGRVEEVLVDEGSRVKAGDVIGRLDPSEAQVAVQRAEAERQSAAAEVASAAASARQARRTYQRTSRLAEVGAATVEARDDARTAMESAEASVRAARARVRAAERALAAARLQLESTVVRAPFDGTVVRKIASEGAVLAPATVAQVDVGGLVELVDLDALEVEAEVSEEQLTRLRPGQPALVFLDAFPDRVWRAEASSLRPAVDRSKATATVKVRFVDPVKGALPGMGARVSFLSRPLEPRELRGEAGRRVPASAVLVRDGVPAVLVVEEERVREVPVKLGERVGDEYVLREGPAAGQRVVLAPGRRLREGRRVKVAR
jgi:RND family efflux transporter MFP subunit